MISDRDSGIEVIGRVPWGTHFCAFYKTREDLVDILVPYFEAGLKNNEFCMCVTSEPLGVDDIEARMSVAIPGFEEYLKKGQIEVIPYTEWYLIDGVFSNLIGNAIKHSPENERVEINIKLDKPTDNGEGYCRVAVEDNGPGIPDSLKGKLFNRFERGNTKAHGKGLGLYIVRSLIEDYHGQVWVEDRVPGDHTQGARFVVMLPAAR